MNKNLTEIVFVLDRSGSMYELAQDTIGGFNSFIDQQKNEPGEALLTTILFDSKYEILHNGINLKDVKPITKKEYYVRDTTALLDAIGKAINDVGHRLDNTKEESKPSQVIFVITTDGQENSSKEFTAQQIKEMVEHQTNVYNWKFVFLGANMDAVDVGNQYGISYVATYSATTRGTKSVYSTVANLVSNSRSSGEIDENWSTTIE